MASEGTFVLADIGGYTQFLTGVGMEHAKEITSDLFNAMLKANGKRWKVAKIEGDCIFFYREGREPTDALLAHIRTLYEEFCTHVIDIAARASCPCGACTRTNQLTLKFVVHAGEFDVQKIGNREELIGPDLVVAHRLLKNSIPIDEYVLLTSECSGGPAAQALPASEGQDEYGDVGLVSYTYLDLETVRDEIEKKMRFFVAADQARMRVVIDIDASADAVWDAMWNREKHLEWSGEKEHWEAPGRRGRIGQVHRCVPASGPMTVWVITAEDDDSRRQTAKFFLTPLARNMYSTSEVSERPDGGSRLANYIAFDEAIPIVSHLVRPVLQLLGEHALRKGLLRLKAYCEAQVS